MKLAAMQPSHPEARTHRHSLLWQLTLNNLSALVPPILLMVFMPQYGWRAAARCYLYSVVFANIIGTMASFVMPRTWPYLAGRTPLVRWCMAVVSLIVIAFVGCTVANVLLVVTGATPQSAFWSDYRVSLELSVLITLIFGIAATSYETMRKQLEETTLELRTKELERERALKLATEARLSSLESRLHPHFLFNTLNSVSSLIRDDPKRAERLIEQMAALLRFSLDSAHVGSVPLEREMKIVEDYLEIEKARCGDRLRYEIDLPDDVTGIGIPPLTIQTLVENSVKYAVAPRREGGVIRIRGRVANERFHIEVTDDGPGFTIESLLPGHGLDNLQSRLLALYGMDAALGLSRNADGMAVTVSVPRTRAVVRA